MMNRRHGISAAATVAALATSMLVISNAGQAFNDNNVAQDERT